MTGVRSCISGKMESGIINKDYAKELLRKVDDLEKQLVEFPFLEGNKGYEGLVKRIKESAVNKKRSFMKSLDAEKRILAQAEKHPKGTFAGLTSTLTYDLAGRADGLNVEKLAETVRAQAYGEMPTVAKNMTAGRLGMGRNIEGGQKFIRALFGDESDDLGNQMAKEWKTVSAKIRDRFVRGGGDIGEIEDWRIPTSHDARLIQQAGREKWIEETIPLLDRNKMKDHETGWPLSKANLRRVLDEVYDTLSTRGLNKYSDHGKTIPLADKYTGSRVLHFKDGDSWLKYNEMFGNSDPFITVNQYVNNMANDIGFIETWGPNPDALKKKVVAREVNKAAAKGDKEYKKALKDAEYFNRIWDEVTGEASVPVQTAVATARFNSGVRNMLMAAQLGSAFLTTFSDAATNAMTVHFNGLSQTELFKNLGSLMLSNKKRDFAMHLGLGGDEIARILSGGVSGSTRFLGDMIPESGWTGRVAATTIKASLMERITVAGKKAFSLDFVHCLADNADVEFSNLNKALKNAFERYGITEEDWNIARKSKLDDYNGAKYLNIIELSKQNESVANKISNMIFTERDFAVIDTNVRTHAIMTQGHKRGTFMGEALRYMAMYKTFPVTIMTHHITRMMNIDSMGSKLGYAGGLFAGLTMTGYLTMQAKLLVSGKKPAKADKWNTWRDAMLAGGACGVLGDIMFGETRGNLMADKAMAIAGPGFSLLKDTYDLTIGNIQEAESKRKQANFWEDAALFAKRYTPLTNLWYTRLATERYLWDNLEMIADKKARERFYNREKQQQYRYGRGYWWNPGKAKPKF